MFIIEGSDNLGKTQLAHRIVEHCKNSGYPIRYSHMSRQNQAFDFFYDYQDLMSWYAVQDRFHLGALVWHDGVLPPPRLKILEGWIYSRASYICILYSENDRWYRQHCERAIEEEGKREMFSVDKIIEGNGKYRSFVQNRSVQFDRAISINGDGEFTPDSIMREMVGEWHERLRATEAERRRYAR